MADLQAALAEAVKLNQHITQFLKFSTYPEYNDLSGLDIDFHDGEQILIWDELRRITERLADVQEYISYLTRPVAEESRLSKGTAGKYRTAKGHYYDCTSVIEALVSDEYHDVPYWTITSVEHNGKDYYLVGHKDIPMKGLQGTARPCADPALAVAIGQHQPPSQLTKIGCGGGFFAFTAESA